MDKVAVFEAYFKEWLKGIKYEIDFWNKLMETGGVCGGSPDVYEMRISKETPFFLEEEIENENPRFCDVGSGPFSNCGYKSKYKDLEIVAVDPLASAYEQLKRKWNVSSPITPISGMVEILNVQFESNQFDIVHMSNALDHCFDPIEGILQLLNICKVGGKVILRHNENEAEHAKYKGFHQWNIHLEDGKFIIWRDDERIDVGEQIKEFAIIEKAEMSCEKVLSSNWTHNKFVIRKIKDVSISESKYLKCIVPLFLEEICKLNIES